MVTIIFNWKEAKAKRFFEPWVHLLAVAFPIVTGVIGLRYQLFNPHPQYGVCGFASLPIRCQGDGCLRGNHEFATVMFLAHAILVCLAGLLAVVCVWSVVVFVKRQRRKVRARYGFDSTRTDAKDMRVRAVYWQAIFYTLSFGYLPLVFLLNMTLRLVMTKLGVNVASDSPGWMKVTFGTTTFIMSFLTPLQGLFTCFVYMRPILLRWKDMYPSNSYLWAFRQVVSGKKAPVTRRTRHLANTKSRPPSSVVSNNLSANERISIPTTYRGSDPTYQGSLPSARDTLIPAALPNDPLAVSDCCSEDSYDLEPTCEKEDVRKSMHNSIKVFLRESEFTDSVTEREDENVAYESEIASSLRSTNRTRETFRSSIASLFRKSAVVEEVDDNFESMENVDLENTGIASSEDQDPVPGGVCKGEMTKLPSGDDASMCAMSNDYLR